MKLKLILITFSIVIISTLFSFTLKQSSHFKFRPTTETIDSCLILYGEHVFNREKCGMCHSLVISNDMSKISLDGLKGKYSVSWHYQHLIDPRSMVPNSGMPSYSFLEDIALNEDSIEKYSTILTNEDKINLFTETQKINSAFNENTMKSNSEMAALIKYLDNIPQSNEYKLKYAKEMEIELKNKAIRDSLWAKSDEIITVEINNPNSIVLGEKIYKLNCSPCHGFSGEGIIGPNLTDEYWLHGGKEHNIVSTIVNGVREKGMLSWKLMFSPNEVGQLVAYIKSIQGTNPKNAKMSQGTKE